MTRRLPDSEHTSRPWRIHELTPDFRLEDVWGVPVPRGPEDFGAGVAVMAGFDPSRSSSLAVRGLFALRWWIGGPPGWDEEGGGVGSRVPALREGLPDDLRAA